MRYKVVYIGNYYKIAEILFFQKNIELIEVICEKNKLDEDLLTFSLVRNIPIRTVESSTDIVKSINILSDKIDFGIMCSFGKRIPIEKIKKCMLFNIHYAALPNYKGRHPTFWATIKGENEIGISVHKVTKNIDEGDIIGQEVLPYYLWMDEDSLFSELTKKVPLLVEACVEYLKSGKRFIENKSGNYYPPVTEELYTIDLCTDNCQTIFNKVRAQSKYQGGKLMIGDKIFWIKKIKFLYLNMEEKYLEKEEILYIKYNDNICIKCYEYSVDE